MDRIPREDETDYIERNARLLELCASHLQTALDAVREDFDSLTHTLLEALSSLEPRTVKADQTSVIERMQNGDRINQRLQSVARILSLYSASIRSNPLPMADHAWDELLSSARNVYTTSEERAAFDLAFPRHAPSAAVDAVSQSMDDSIELFGEESGG